MFLCFISPGSEIPAPDPSLVVGGQLTMNVSCTVLEYSCRAGPVSVITLQYNCSREQWSATDMCNGTLHKYFLKHYLFPHLLTELQHYDLVPAE